MLKINKSFLFLIPILAVLLTTATLYSADDFVSSKVKDISDRSYEPAVIQLLDNAKNSIVISMYSISSRTKAKTR